MNSRRSFLRAIPAAVAALFGLRKLATATSRPELPVITAPTKVFWPELLLKVPIETLKALGYRWPHGRLTDDQHKELAVLAERALPPGWELVGMADPKSGVPRFTHCVPQHMFAISGTVPVDSHIQIMAVNAEMIIARAQGRYAMSEVASFEEAPAWEARYKAGKLDWVQIKGPTPKAWVYEAKYGTKA